MYVKLGLSDEGKHRLGFFEKTVLRSKFGPEK
jgi:hypothetical protein